MDTLMPEPVAPRAASGRWLVAARAVCLAITLLTAGLYVAGLPLMLAEYSTVCTSETCSRGQLTPERVAALEERGLSLDFYAGYTEVVKRAARGRLRERERSLS